MKKIQIEIELTDKQVEFLKNLVISSEKEFTYKVDDYDMYNDLINKGIVVEYETAYAGNTNRFLSDLGYQIKKLIN
jgi:hypothetical protein